jgi:hypothetical protein
MEKEEPHLPCKETEEHRTAVQALFPLGRDGTSVPTETGINEYHVNPRYVPTIFLRVSIGALSSGQGQDSKINNSTLFNELR